MGQASGVTEPGVPFAAEAELSDLRERTHKIGPGIGIAAVALRLRKSLCGACQLSGLARCIEGGPGFREVAACDEGRARDVIGVPAA